MIKKKIRFEKVIPTSVQVELLYELLKLRENTISHSLLPEFKEHKSFVEKNPYVDWFIIIVNDLAKGSCYIQKDNSIGINISGNIDEDEIIETFDFIKQNYMPLPAIKSVRRGEFFINISPSNSKLSKILKKLEKKQFQISYLI